MRHIENLVFKGGGVLGIAYSGAIQALDDANMLSNIKGVAGTSAGSIIATLLSLKYSPQEIKNLVAATNFKNFEDKWDPFRIPTEYGLYKGAYFLKWIKGIIKQKTGNENSTFEDLKNQGFRDLKVFATDLNEASAKEFSFAKSPKVIVAESVRASMSIPFFFEAWKFSNNIPDNHLYVDGGTVYNYPITAFDDLSTTLGFFLYNKNITVSNLDYHELRKYVKTLFLTLMKAQVIDFEKDSLEDKITVMIDDFGIPATDFDIDIEQETQLFNSGLKATAAYLSSMNDIA